MESIHILSSHCTSFVSYEKRFNSQELPFPFPHFTKIQTGPQARLVVKSVVITESANNQDSQNKSKTCKIYHKNEQNQTKPKSPNQRLTLHIHKCRERNLRSIPCRSVWDERHKRWQTREEKHPSQFSPSPLLLLKLLLRRLCRARVLIRKNERLGIRVS